MIATIGKIIQIDPIEGADRIVSATVVCGHAGRWMGVIQKGELAVGDKVTVFLQDALLPEDTRWDFMSKHHWRVRMQRFKKVPSECLILPLYTEGEVGDDIASQLGVTKYEKPIPASLQGDIYGSFPSFIPRTDEQNFQAVPELVEQMRGKPYVATVKYDGTSCTVYRFEGHFGVCSRNWEMKPGPNVYWEAAYEYKLEDLPLEGLALQFEVIGPGIQGNPLELKKREIRLFAVWDIREKYYWPFSNLFSGLPCIEVVSRGLYFPVLSDEELRQWAVGAYPNGKSREGIVIRSLNQMTEDKLSFKVINLEYKS